MSELSTLFYNNPDRKNEQEQKVLERPLGPLSDYVVEQLSVDLEGVRNGTQTIDVLSQQAALLDEQQAQELTSTLTPRELDVATLDAKMLESAIIHSNGTPPPSLVSAVDILSASVNQPPGMTYEEIVLINPQTDRRTFTRGEVGQTERDFYQGHVLIEGHLTDAVTDCQNLISSLSNQGQAGISEAGQRLTARTTDIVTVVDFMKSFHRMNRDHFATFRTYFNSHPTRELKGPSGAFSATFPALDLLLAGDPGMKDYFQYLIDNNQYFPREGRLQIADAFNVVSQGKTLLNLCEELGNPDELRGPLGQMYQLIASFRAKHIGAVSTHLPDAMANKLKGSGGESEVKTFLKNRYDNSRSIHKNKFSN